MTREWWWLPRPRQVTWSQDWLPVGAGPVWECSPAVEHERILWPLAEALSTHAYGDPTGCLATALLEVGRAGEVSGTHCSNGSPLYLLLREPPDKLNVSLWLGHRGIGLARETLARAATLAAKARPTSPEAELLRAELDYTIALLRHACDRGEWALTGYGKTAPSAPAPLRQEAERLSADFRTRWLARSRPGGLDDSTTLLRHALLEEIP